MNAIRALGYSSAHVFLFAVFWVLRGFHQLQRYASTSELLLVLVLLLLTLCIALKAIRLVIDDKMKAAIILLIIILPFLLYGEIQSAVIRARWIELSRFRFLLTSSVIFVVILSWTVYKASGTLHALNLYLNTITFTFVMIELGFIAGFQNRLPANQYTIQENKKHQSAAMPEVPRDIYYIILDSYTSSASLKEFWNFDNSKFIHYLKATGFYVAENARSNYNLTIYSMASSLNMSYLNVPYEKPESFTYRVLPMRHLIQGSRVARELKGLGYDIVNLSLFDLLDEKKFYSYPLQDHDHLLRMQLARKTLPGTMIDNLYLNVDPGTPLDVATALRTSSRHRSSRPRFIYAHFMIPHAPYFYDDKGRLRPFRSRIGKPSADQDRQLYLEQLIFTSDLARETINHILKHSQIQPIVVLQGDHGSWCFDGTPGKKETTTILNALFLPDIDHSVLYDSITPVNSFRVILDQYFRTDYGLLPDKIFVTEDDYFNVSLLRP